MASRELLTGTQGKDWNALAKQLSTRPGNPSTATIASLLAQTNNKVPFKQASSVLDNGCGTGAIMTALLSTHGDDLDASCSLTCSDFSEGMIEQVNGAKAKHAAAGDSHWPRVDTMVSNAMDMSAVLSSSQSHILAGWVYFLTPDPQKCLSESLRMLKPGGVLGLSSWEDSQWLQVMRVLSDVFPDRSLPSLPDEWNSPAAVKHEMEKAGFENVDSSPITVHLGYQTHDDIVKFLTTTTPPMVAALKGLSDEEVQLVRDAMARKCAELNPEQPGQLSGDAIIAVGTKPAYTATGHQADL